MLDGKRKLPGEDLVAFLCWPLHILRCTTGEQVTVPVVYCGEGAADPVYGIDLLQRTINWIRGAVQRRRTR